MDQTVLKIEYLRELRLRIESGGLDEDDISAIEKRRQSVCDSIEKDLEINKPFTIGDVKVKLHVEDVQPIVEEIKKKLRVEKWLT